MCLIRLDWIIQFEKDRIGQELRMGACINQKPKLKNKNDIGKVRSGQKVGKSQIGLARSKEITVNQLAADHTLVKEDELPKIKQKTRRRLFGEQFTAIYRVEENVGTASRAEGPKYISNFSDGSARVLRVLPFGSTLSEAADSIEERVKAYAQICGLELQEDEQANLLIFQEYYSGPTLDCVPKEQLQNFLVQVYEIIARFHEKNIVMGNLNIFSFRQVSQFDPTVQLTDINLASGSEEAMGHAHRDDRSMDWEAFGYFVQFALSPQPPIFIPHKLHYVQAAHPIVNEFLKGKKIPKQKLEGLPYKEPIQSTSIGYRYRNDVLKLIKLRKRRQGHRETYYPEQTLDTNGKKLSEQMLHRLETTRIFLRIEDYAEKIEKNAEQAFLMYSDASDKYKRLKPTFVEKEKENKLSELKEALPMLK